MPYDCIISVLLGIVLNVCLLHLCHICEIDGIIFL